MSFGEAGNVQRMDANNDNFKEHRLCSTLDLYKMAPNTPWKIHMEPTNHPFIKENDLPNLHDYVPC